jgi:hypothetical protein
MNGLTDWMYCTSEGSGSERVPLPMSVPEITKTAQVAKAVTGCDKRSNVSVRKRFDACSQPTGSGSAAIRFQTSEENPRGAWHEPQDLSKWSSWESFMALEYVDGFQFLKHRQAVKPLYD